MCYVYPKVNYGQGDRAYNPSSRGDMYQQVQRAGKDAGFARQFAADILFGQPGKGDFDSTQYWTWKDQYGSGAEPDYLGQKLKRVSTSDSYLFNENSLNASKSWVAQAFNAPAMKGGDGNWYRAEAVVDKRDLKKGAQYGFKAGERIADAQTVRMLNEGHYAFTASGYDGSQVYVPWSQNYIPTKGERGMPETENAKKQSEKRNNVPERGMVSPSTAEPANVLAGKNLLGSGANRKTLLG